jgi:pimeloyl-ACP methyl ester carboxylesterase
VLQAAASGVKMRRIAVYEAPYVGVHERDGRPMDYVGDLESRLARGDRGAALRYFMVDIVGQPAFSLVIMRVIPNLWGSLTSVAHTLVYDSRLMGSYRVPAELGAVTVPTLVLGGGKAEPDMADAVARVAATVPASELRILPGQTHQVKNSAIAPVLIEYFGGN